MKRVLAFVKMNGSEAVTIQRTIWPLQALETTKQWECKFMAEEQALELAQGKNLEALKGFDLYLFSRVHGPGEQCPFAEELPTHARYVYECDDDLTDQYRDQGYGEFVSDTMGWVHACTVSTPHLGKVMERYGKPVHVLPTCLPVEWWSQQSVDAPRSLDGLTIGLVGTATHFFDWALVLEDLKRIQHDYPQVNVVTIGYCPPYLEDVAHFPGVPYMNYPALLRQIDVRLCPLEEDPFNLSKSDIAAVESMAAGRKVGKMVVGAIPVCSDHPVYNSTIIHRETGLLVRDGKWYEALAELIERGDLRRRLAINGFKWVKAHRDLPLGTASRVAAYKQILEA